MAANHDDLFRSVLDLNERQRAELAALLIESLDEGEDSGVDAAWRVEIERRMKDLDSGAVETVPWAEAKKRLFSGLNG